MVLAVAGARGWSAWEPGSPTPCKEVVLGAGLRRDLEDGGPGDWPILPGAGLREWLVEVIDLQGDSLEPKVLWIGEFTGAIKGLPQRPALVGVGRSFAAHMLVSPVYLQLEESSWEEWSLEDPSAGGPRKRRWLDGVRAHPNKR